VQPKLPEMYPMWVDAENTRVYGIDDDSKGSLWFTGSLNLLHRYWPGSGGIETKEIPEKHGGSPCLCAGGKVYVLPQTNEKITVYDVAVDRVYQVDKPFAEANFWYGHADKARGVLYLPERARQCLVVWDVESDTGEILSYPAVGKLSSIHEVGWSEGLEVFSVPTDEGGWGHRVYYDPDKKRFIAEDNEKIPPGFGDSVKRYTVNYKEGRVIRMDRETGEVFERDVPGWREDFGFIGGGVFYEGWQLNNLSTYDASFRYDEKSGEYIQLKDDPYQGVDGHPYHFMDRFIGYHPASDTFDFLKPDVPEGKYPQLCYNKVSQGHLFITANDIWSSEENRALGSIENPIGQLMIFQTKKQDKE
jgi:hypothetical protein